VNASTLVIFSALFRRLALLMCVPQSLTSVIGMLEGESKATGSFDNRQPFLGATTLPGRLGLESTRSVILKSLLIVCDRFHARS
jgi:hypothetical protein